MINNERSLGISAVWNARIKPYNKLHAVMEYVGFKKADRFGSSPCASQIPEIARKAWPSMALCQEFWNRSPMNNSRPNWA
jgi:hypothetical protein